MVWQTNADHQSLHGMSPRVLTVGIPREIKSGEKRVGLTPQGVRALTSAGIPVLVQKNCGEGSGFSDSQFQEAGAEVLSSLDSFYQKSGLVKKVKEPLPAEWKYLKPNLILFGFLHLASPSQRELLQNLMDRRVIGIGLETIEKEGRAVALEPMSEIAGTLAGYLSGFLPHYAKVEKGKVVYAEGFSEALHDLAGHYPEAPTHLTPGKVFVFGGGTVGRNAVEAVLKMGGEVDLLEKREIRRKVLLAKYVHYGQKFRIWSAEESYVESVRSADLWIGCVHNVGERAALMFTREELELLSKDRQRAIIDVAVDQGGNFPETHPTYYEDPLYVDSFGNLRFSVANIPSLCGKGASEALETATLPYTISLALDWKAAFERFSELRKGLQVFQGRLVHEAIAHSHEMHWSPLTPSDLQET